MLSGKTAIGQGEGENENCDCQELLGEINFRKENLRKWSMRKLCISLSRGKSSRVLCGLLTAAALIKMRPQPSPNELLGSTQPLYPAVGGALLWKPAPHTPRPFRRGKFDFLGGRKRPVLATEKIPSRNFS